MSAAAPSTLVHQHITRLPNGDLVLRDRTTSVSHLFTPAQLLLFAAFDRDVRAGTFDPTTAVIPGGYELFQDLWSADADCAYQFAFYDAADGTHLVAGASIPVDLLVPDGIDMARVRSRYTPRQEDILYRVRFLRLRSGSSVSKSSKQRKERNASW
ncbi:hypothetical protein A0H81_13845 [Grifola frondosa]|uniref:Uncharacterized protein n=1 Tax=Grifola frondosa TaxID=5627 RepID=A0A1C7LQP9_GRIFR|nr:hypothetical protein A0H81_13845 [Grifola frondosa]